MMERMPDIGYPPTINKFRPEQIAQQASWTVIPEARRVEASMHIIHSIPANGSTLTYVNPVDPGDECYYDMPKTWDRVNGNAKMRM